MQCSLFHALWIVISLILLLKLYNSITNTAVISIIVNLNLSRIYRITSIPPNTYSRHTPDILRAYFGPILCTFLGTYMHEYMQVTKLLLHCYTPFHLCHVCITIMYSCVQLQVRSISAVSPLCHPQSLTLH